MAGKTSRYGAGLIAAVTSVALGLSVGCATTAAGGRLGTAEVQATAELSAEARADLRAELLAEIRTEIETQITAQVQGLAAAIAVQPDQSRREAPVDASGESRVRIDQSTADRWPTRIMAGALCLNMLLTIWLSQWNEKRRRRKAFSRQQSAVSQATTRRPAMPHGTST